MLTYQKETKHLRPKVDEQSSAWVRFHNGKEYLLPIIIRRQKLVPIFNEDGSIGMTVVSPDAAIGPLIDSFIELVSTVEGNIITITAGAYGQFIDLIRRLLQTNYDMSNDDLIILLSMKQEQISFLIENLLQHLRRA